MTCQDPSTVSSIATPQQHNPVHQEGRLDLAVQAYGQGHFRSCRAAAKAFDVPRTTLQRRIQGQLSRRDCIPHNCLLTPIKEQSLLDWILSMDRRGMPPCVATVRKMAHLLLRQRS